MSKESWVADLWSAGRGEELPFYDKDKSIRTAKG